MNYYVNIHTVSQACLHEGMLYLFSKIDLLFINTALNIKYLVVLAKVGFQLCRPCVLVILFLPSDDDVSQQIVVTPNHCI